MNRRVGILGAGYIAEFHVTAIASMPNAQIAAVCDLDRARAQRLADAHGIPGVYGDLAEMLAQEKIDAVHILLPPDAHATAAEQVINAGVSVFLEKPFCTTRAECEHLVELSETKQCQIGVSHNFLFSPAYEGLRKDLEAKRLGRIDEVVVVWNKELPQITGGPFGGWMFRSPGNLMGEIGPHSFAHLLDILGQPDEMDAVASDPVEPIAGVPVYKRWLVHGRKGSARFELRFGFGKGYSEHRVHVRGSLGTGTVDFERDTYARQLHTTYPMDVDRYFTALREAGASAWQSSAVLLRYVLSIFGVKRFGSPYETSIIKSTQAFYRGLDHQLERRVSGRFGSDVAGLCEDAPRLAKVEPAPARPDQKPQPKPDRDADILVLGGTGFIGRELVRQLVESDHAVRLLSRSGTVPKDLAGLPLEVIRGDLADPESIDRALEGIDVVFHLAKSSGISWDEFLNEDIVPTERLAEACLRAGVRRLVYSSSIAVYYAGPRAGTITEDTPPHPDVLEGNVYAKAKVEAERRLEALHRTRGLGVVIVRPGIVIGSGGSPFHPGVASWHYDSVCEIHGPGNTPLPIVLVSDVADALVRCIAADGIDGKSFNLVGPPCLDSREYVAELERSAGVRFARRMTPSWLSYAGELFKWVVKVAARRPNRVMPAYRSSENHTAAAPYDCSQAKQLLGWDPTADRGRVIGEGIDAPVREFLVS